MGKTALWVLTTCMLLAACEDSAVDGDGDGSGGSGAAGDETTSSGTAGGGAGSGGSSGCPLDATGKLRVAAIAGSSAGTAGWILMNTHGHGAFAGRGFGTVVPLTTAAALYSATLMEPCAGPSEFVPYCEEPPPGEPAEPFTRCSQLVCEGEGELAAKVWLEGLPATVASDPAPGNTTVVATDHSTHFVETGTDGIEITWQGTVELSFDDGTSAIWSASGAGTVDAASSSATTSDEITGIAAEAVTVELALADEAPSGQISYGGAAIAEVDHDGVEWVGACAP
jgi:hypothetical protein